MMPAAAPGSAPRPRLRVALLLGDCIAPAWVQQVVSDLRASGDAEIVLVALDASLPPERQRGIDRIWRRRRTLAYQLYARLDDALYGRPDDAFAPRPLAALLEGVPVLRVLPERTDVSDLLDDADVERIRAFGLDVVLCLGFRRLRGRVLGVARHGVLSLVHGDGAASRETPAGFWEVADAEPATAVAVVRLREPGEGDSLLRSALLLTDPRSPRCNRSEAAWKGAALFGWALRDLRARGAAQASRGLRDRAAPAPHRAGPPSNREMLLAAFRIGGRALRDRLLRLVSFEQWALAFSLEEAGPGEVERFTELLPPKDRLWADPFPFEHEGRLYVFLEECRRGSPRAHLSVMELESGGRWSTPRIVLERPYHLSYPFVFAWNGSVWMLPETSENRSVELYRCERFPDRWVLDRVLLEGVRACDATLHQQDGHWWMFVSMSAARARMFDDLHLFHAQTPLGPWQPAAGNPICSDVRSARPAGRLFLRDGQWIRPAQDGSGRYGRAIRFQRVSRLDPGGYAESEQRILEPGWAPGVLGTHTWNAAGPLTVIDFIKRRRRFW